MEFSFDHLLIPENNDITIGEEPLLRMPLDAFSHLQPFPDHTMFFNNADQGQGSDLTDSTQTLKPPLVADDLADPEFILTEQPSILLPAQGNELLEPEQDSWIQFLHHD